MHHVLNVVLPETFLVRDQNCTEERGSGFVGFSVPSDKNYDPSLFHHLNQLQVLTHYFITVL